MDCVHANPQQLNVFMCLDHNPDQQIRFENEQKKKSPEEKQSAIVGSETRVQWLKVCVEALCKKFLLQKFLQTSDSHLHFFFQLPFVFFRS